MSKEIKVLFKPVTGPARFINIPNTLEACQELVEGYIETVRIAADTILVRNEEGVINDMPFNATVCGVSIFGPFFFCGTKHGDFCSVVDNGYFQKLFPNLFDEEA